MFQNYNILLQKKLYIKAKKNKHNNHGLFNRLTYVAFWSIPLYKMTMKEKKITFPFEALTLNWRLYSKMSEIKNIKNYSKLTEPESGNSLLDIF